MATDVDAIVRNLRAFHDLRDKSVVHVGAGGGELIGYAVDARRVVGVDPDPDAVSRLESAIESAGLTDRFSVVRKEFATVTSPADVVFFEFCLHEMDDPDGALRHARTLAPEILILDHLPESRWAWCACEEEKAARSWGAVRKLNVVREKSFRATQRFEDYARLLAKLRVLGERAVDRIAEFAGREDITIEMGYAMAIVRGAG